MVLLFWCAAQQQLSRLRRPIECVFGHVPEGTREADEFDLADECVISGCGVNRPV